MIININCPHCGEKITLEIKNNKIVNVFKEGNELSEKEIAQILKNNNIELG